VLVRSIRVAFGMLLCISAGCSDEDAPAAFIYPRERAAACDGVHTGDEIAMPQRTAHGVRFIVRVPVNYDASFRHPLLVVFSAAGADAERTERFTGFTPVATRRGVIVAYVDRQPLSPEAAERLADVPRGIARKWCVDAAKVYLAGHSDGATFATAIAVMKATRGVASGIAVSAAGFRSQDLAREGCPAGVRVMVMQGTKDTLFPGWGADAASWWASCNGCSEASTATAGDLCRLFMRCAPQAPVAYCASPTAHSEWPRLQSRALDFLLSAPRH
jgi:polyhydroxybutyrate depolymerase